MESLDVFGVSSYTILHKIDSYMICEITSMSSNKAKELGIIQKDKNNKLSLFVCECGIKSLETDRQKFEELPGDIKSYFHLFKGRS